ncbi:MAG: hypothetical protein GXO40_04405 [Epsilonproteobacteria bacterium]|nr:hypothetical protein [Campylobacterota bacterium]
MRFLIIFCATWLFAALPHVYDPFEDVIPKQLITTPAIQDSVLNTRTVKFKLIAVLNDKALISANNTSKWVQVGSNIAGYKVVVIKDELVTLRKGKHVITLQFKHKKI